jgi:hypothetical protein
MNTYNFYKVIGAAQNDPNSGLGDPLNFLRSGAISSMPIGKYRLLLSSFDSLFVR